MTEDEYPEDYQPLTLQESLDLNRQSMQATVKESKETDFLSSLVTIQTNSSRLNSYHVVHFEEWLTTTKESNIKAGAILLKVECIAGFVDCWFPKKCCVNLNTANNTVLVWDNIIEDKFDAGEFDDWKTPPYKYNP